jgi:hypothetical protein
MTTRHVWDGVAQLPRRYAGALVLMVFGPGAIRVAQGHAVHPSVVAVVVLVLLFAGLARRWPGAWLVLLGYNVLYALSSAIVPAGGPAFEVGAPLRFALSLVCAALLLSPSMLRYVDIRRGRTPGPRSAVGR